MGRRLQRGDPLEKAITKAKCTAAEAASMVAINDFSPSPGDMGWLEWKSGADGIGKLLLLQRTVPEARTVILAVLCHARQTIPSAFKEGWTSQLQRAAKAILEDMSTILRSKSNTTGCSVPLKQASGTHKGPAETAAFSQRALVPYLDDGITDPHLSLVMFALQVQYVDTVFGRLAAAAATEVDAELREPVPLTLEETEALVVTTRGVDVTAIPPPVRRVVVTSGPPHRPSDAVTRQEWFLDSIMKMLPLASLVDVTSNLAGAEPTHDLLGTSAFLAVQFSRPPWSDKPDEVQQSWSCCCMKGTKKKKVMHPYLTFNAMLADPDWANVVSSAILRHRLRTRDVNAAVKAFERKDICNSSVAVLVRLDFHMKKVLYQQEFLHRLHAATDANDFFAQAAGIQLSQLFDAPRMPDRARETSLTSPERHPSVHFEDSSKTSSGTQGEERPLASAAAGGLSRLSSAQTTSV
jgi:hypothetical protein